jgi:hypothetical protein
VAGQGWVWLGLGRGGGGGVGGGGGTEAWPNASRSPASLVDDGQRTSFSLPANTEWSG